jgi:RHS repeat-associated protein
VRTRFPKTAKPQRVSLSFDILEDRVAVSEQISTLLAVLLLTGVESPVRRRFEQWGGASSAAPGLRPETSWDAALPPGVVPSEQIALVPAAAAPAVVRRERPAWRTDSLNPTLLGEPDQERFALDLTLNPPRHVRGGGPVGGAEPATAVAATGGTGGAAPDAGSLRGVIPGGPGTTGLGGGQALPSSGLASTALGFLPPVGVRVPAGAPAQVIPSAGGALGSASAQPPASKAPYVPPRNPPPPAAETVNVLDANNAIVLNQNVTKLDYSGYTVSLFAQVDGATVGSYSWSLSGAPDAENITGSSAYNLQFDWKAFTGAARSEKIVLTTTDVPSGGKTLTFPYLVYGTDSPGYTSTQPTTYGSWNPVLQPDAIKPDQDTVAGQYYQVGLDTGELMIDHPLPSYNPGVAPLDLVYNSAFADRKDLFVAHYPIPDNRTDTPTSVADSLVISSGNQASVSNGTISTSGLVNPGDIMELSLRGNEDLFSAGRYSWSFTVTATYTNAPTTVTTGYSGTLSIVNPASTIFGHGWSLANVEQVLPISGTPGAGAGAIVQLPGGQSLWFATPVGGGFTTPPGDFSTLVQNGDSTYTRTLSDGTKLNFNSSGYEISQVDRNTNALTFTYSGANLLSIQDFNNQTTTLTYSGSQVSTITDPANRVVTLSYDATGHQLTSIQGPDPGNGATIPTFTFGYDNTNDHVLTMQDPRGHTATFAYVTHRIATIARMDGVTETVLPLQVQGFRNSFALAAETQATYTDGAGNQWQSRHDWQGFGRPTQQQNPRTDVTAMVVTQRDQNGLPWLSADALARRSRYQYDSLGNPTLTGYPDDTKEQYTYNSFSQPTSFTDANGKVTNFTRDADGNLITLQYPSPDGVKPPVTIGYTYVGTAPGGRIQSVKDANGNVTSYGYDATRKNLNVSVTYPYEPTLGFSPFITLTYDSYADLIAQRNARNYITTWAYDGLNRLVSNTLPAQSGPNPLYTYTYDADGNRIGETNPLNKTFTSAFDPLRNQISATDPLLDTQTYIYDNAGNFIVYKDALLNTKTFLYDGANDWVEKIDANAHTWIYTVDAAGQRIGATSPLGYTNGNYTYTFAYTPRGLLRKVTDPVGNWVAYTYNPTEDLVNVDEHDSNPLPNQPADYSSTLTYDNLHNETAFTDPRGIAINYQYDNKGNRTSVSGGPWINSLGRRPSDTIPAPQAPTADGEGAIVLGNAGYLAQLNAVAGPLGQPLGAPFVGKSGLKVPSDNSCPPSFDCSRSASQPTLGLGNGTSGFGAGTDLRFSRVGDTSSGNYTFLYDTRNNLIQRSASTNGAVTYGYSYDENSNLTRYSPSGGGSLGGTMVYAYDAQDRLLSETDSRRGVVTYGYDLAGRLQSITDPDLNVTTYSYDDANRLAYITDPRNKFTTYSYDAADRVTQIIDRDNRTRTFSYDHCSRLAGETWVNGNMSVVYTYDDAGRLTSERDAYSDYTYAYDAADRVLQVDNNNTPGVPRVTLIYGYDGFSNRNSVTDNLSTNDAITYSYDTDRQLTGVTWNVGGSQKAQVVLAYDNQNRLYRIDRSVPTTSTLLTTTWTYDQPLVYRVVNMKHSYGQSTLDSFTYTYDFRDRVVGYNGPDGNLTYSYDSTDQLVQVAGSQSANYGYDLNGNRTMAGYVTDTGNRLRSDGAFTYAYDDEGNMLSITSLADSTKYMNLTWDYRNRLVGMVSTLGTVTYSATYTYDMHNRRIGKWVNGVQSWTAYDGFNAVFDFNGSTLATRYLMGSIVDQLFARYNNATGALSWYLPDILCAVRQIVDSNGGNLDQITYDSFGNILNETSPANGDRYKFAGREWDSETGFYQDRARDYDPSAGRFVSQDPISFLGLDSNLYRYAGNDPTSFEDTFGLGFFYAVWSVCRRRKTAKWKCTTKPRGDCPSQCQVVFVGYGATRDAAKAESEGSCQAAGCHTPGGTPFNCNCGHTTCTERPN